MRCRGAITIVLVWIVSLTCLSAVAVAAETFGVAKFTLQTTHAKEVREVVRDGVGRRFVNEPYVYTQAGGHPDALTGTLELNSEGIASLPNSRIPAGGDPKDVVVDLPPGLLGNPMALPRCELVLFTRNGRCPPSTQVGITEVEFGASLLVEEIYNLVPERGQSAEFGIPTGGGFNVVLTAHVVRSNGSYGLAIVSNGIPMRGFTRFMTSFWGVPADPMHDPERGLQCESDVVGFEPVTCNNGELQKEGGEPAGVAEVPFLSLPGDCAAGPVSASVSIDSWQNPGHYVPGSEATTLPAATGCGALSFDPSMEILPDTKLVDEPVGLGVNLKVPQPEEPGVPSTPELRDAVVTLPNGLSINPGIVDGIQACNESGREGINFEGPESERLGPDGEPQLAPGHCPNASIVGTAEAVTPLLPEPVKGHLYLARPLCGAPGEEACHEVDALNGHLYRLYLELGGEGALADTGVNFKTAGVVSANLATGQLSSSFLNNPQLPFSELILHLNGGPRASLANPQACGEARSTADFTPWSAPGGTPLVAGTPDANPFSYYTVTGCAGPPGLAPGLVTGTSIPDAGAFSPFTFELTRRDGEQDLAGIQVHTPPGLLGMLSSVTLCQEPDAARGTCPTASRIGSTTVASGAGSHPFQIAGTVYLTSGYKGAPFGLSIVTNVVAGPFHLGLVIVRARIDVDPHTSTLTVTSDRLPQLVFGVPLRLQKVLVSIDRPGFMFNPTNCRAQQINATISGAQNALATVASPFAVGHCKDLAFKPKFTVSTNGHTSRAIGASLDAKLSFPATSPGTTANVAFAKVSLPRQLPSRLSTLQKACPAATFERNPAACPAASIVGIARTSTPVLPVQLSGPVYFVSHGGEAFPSLVVVLEGDGVRVDILGTTFIDGKTNITTSTFKTVPDVPVSSFELFLPQGRNSALAVPGGLCTKTRTVRRTVSSRVGGRLVHRTVRTRVRKPVTLFMPTEFVAQNGAIMRQRTKIAVAGCGSARASSRGRAATRGGRAGK